MSTPSKSREQYDRDGFVVVRGVFSSDEIGKLAMAADLLLGRVDLTDSDNLRCRWQDHHETGECHFYCFDAGSVGGDRREAHYAEFKTRLQERYAEYGKVNTYFR